MRTISEDTFDMITRNDAVGPYDGDDGDHLYSAHIHSIECSWRLTDVLACSQKVSHPEMRLVSAAIGASYCFSF